MNKLFILPTHYDQILEEIKFYDKPEYRNRQGQFKERPKKHLGKLFAIAHIAQSLQKFENQSVYKYKENEKHPVCIPFRFQSKCLKHAFHPTKYTSYLKFFEDTLYKKPYSVKKIVHEYFDKQSGKHIKTTEFIDYHGQCDEEIGYTSEYDDGDQCRRITTCISTEVTHIMPHGEHKGKTTRYIIKDDIWTKPFDIKVKGDPVLEHAMEIVEKFYDIEHKEDRQRDRYITTLLQQAPETQKIMMSNLVVKGVFSSIEEIEKLMAQK
jgi:hypothetical protein